MAGVDAVVEMCHILLAHLCVEGDVHESLIQGVGNAEIHVGLTLNASIGGAQQEPGQADACAVDGHRTFQLLYVESADLTHRGVTYVKLGDRVEIEDAVDGPVDVADIQVAIVHQLGMQQVAAIGFVGHVEQQVAVLPLERAYLIAALGQVDASVLSLHHCGGNANEHRVARQV